MTSHEKLAERIKNLLEECDDLHGFELVKDASNATEILLLDDDDKPFSITVTDDL